MTSLERPCMEYVMSALRLCPMRLYRLGSSWGTKVWNNTLISGGSGTVLQHAGLRECRGYETSILLMRKCSVKLCWEYRLYEDATVCESLFILRNSRDSCYHKLIKSTQFEFHPKNKLFRTGTDIICNISCLLSWNNRWHECKEKWEVIIILVSHPEIWSLKVVSYWINVWQYIQSRLQCSTSVLLRNAESTKQPWPAIAIHLRKRGISSESAAEQIERHFHLYHFLCWLLYSVNHC